MEPTRILLGPQRPEHNIGREFAAAGIPQGPVAVISAGMQDAEGDVDHVSQAIDRDLLDLRLYQRAEKIFAADAALLEAYRARQERLQALQRLYRRRLRPLASALREIYAIEGEDELLRPERRHAVAQVRALDHHHLGRVEATHAEFEQAFPSDSYAQLADHREDISNQIAACSALIITGGNVIVLLNRMRLFGLGDMLLKQPLLAWSAGAMVLAGRIALFHDRTPQGRRDPELLGAGLGLFNDHIFLPDAAQRLRAADAQRTGLFARRFAPVSCVTLDNDCALRFAGKNLVSCSGVNRITRSGQLDRLRAA